MFKVVQKTVSEVKLVGAKKGNLELFPYLSDETLKIS